MASGLTLIFGVTRIVNFAHGSFLHAGGALWSAHAVTHWWPQPWRDSALGAMARGHACWVLGWQRWLGAVAEVLLLRRMRRVPRALPIGGHLWADAWRLHDAMQWFFGPEEVFAPRVFPASRGRLKSARRTFPTWQLFTLLLGAAWSGWGLHLLLKRTLVGPAGESGHPRPRHARRLGREPGAA